MVVRPTQSRGGVKGETSSLFLFPLRSPEAAPLVGFGATPQLFLVKSIQREKSTKGAGSEASLPVTLRIRRCAPKLFFPTPMLCRARLARPCSWSFKHSWSFPQAGVSPLRRRQKGNGNGRSPRSPFGNPRCTLLLVEPFHGKGMRNRREKA